MEKEKNKTRTIEEHVQERIIIDYSIDPTHETRENPEEVKAFNHAKKLLKKDGHVHCFICGCDEEIEYHHFIAEDCFAAIVDFDKLWKIAKVFDIYGYANKANAAPVSVNDPMNLMAICKEHHIEAPGIHSNTFSTWIVQSVVKAGMENPVPQDMDYLRKLKQEYLNKVEHKEGYNK